MSGESQPFLGVRRIPEARGCIFTACEHGLTARGKGDGPNLTLVSGESQQFASVDRIPDSRGLIIATRYDPGAIRRESHGT